MNGCRECAQLTAGMCAKHSGPMFHILHNWPTVTDIPPAPRGWVCPRCATVNAPWVAACFCSPAATQALPARLTPLKQGKATGSA